MLSDSSFPTGGYLVDPSNPIPAPGKPIPPAGTKFCGCQGDGVCGRKRVMLSRLVRCRLANPGKRHTISELGQHCCCYDSKKDDISCQSDPVTSPDQCCGDPAKDCKKGFMDDV